MKLTYLLPKFVRDALSGLACKSPWDTEGDTEGRGDRLRTVASKATFPRVGTQAGPGVVDCPPHDMTGTTTEAPARPETQTPTLPRLNDGFGD